MKKQYAVVVGLLVLGCAILLMGSDFNMPQGESPQVKLHQNQTGWEFVDPFYSGDSVPRPIITIDTTATPVTINRPVSMTSLSVATSNIGVSLSTTVGLYSGSTASQTFGSGFLEVGTTLKYTQSSTFVIHHSASFTTVPAINIELSELASNLTTKYHWSTITPTTSVCTVVVWASTIAATQVTITEATTGSVNVRWSAIGK